jgi:hypothetical protein
MKLRVLVNQIFSIDVTGQVTMSYEVKKDEMIGRHVAEFQAELTLAKSLGKLSQRPPMPYGYPVRLYHPHHSVILPKHTELRRHHHVKLSNNVPWVLGMDLVGNYTVGLYNPKKR